MSLLFDLVKKAQGQDIKKVSETERRERVAICDGCPNLKFGTNCGLCGCFVSDKASYADDHCPEGKW
jgi:hypothetical protein